MSPVVRLATRGSSLALAQARWVADRMRQQADDLDIRIVEIRTRGDVSRAARLGPHLGQSFFTKEVEDALLDGRAEVAVHSCKDLSSTMTAGLTLGAVPAREEPYDVLVSGGALLADLPPGASIGTSSVRRERQLTLVRPDLDVLPLRGNVPTRVRAVECGRFDAVIVASAGLRRLRMANRISEVLSPSTFVPAAGQGALAVQVRDGDVETERWVRPLDDPRSRSEVNAERACMRRLGAGCQAPVGVLARVDGGRLEVVGMVVAAEAAERATASGLAEDAERLGEAVAAELLDRLGLSSLEAWAEAWSSTDPSRDRRPGEPGVPHGEHSHTTER